MTYQRTEVGPRYHCALESATHGSRGLFIKPGTYVREQQLLKRDDVVAAVQQSLSDRDLAFYTRITQADWTRGGKQKVFNDTARFDSSQGVDIHTSGQVGLMPQDTVLAGMAVGQVLAGRGATLAPTGVGGASPLAVFAWRDGNYLTTADPAADAPVFVERALLFATDRIIDIENDGTNIYFALINADGVQFTTSAAPGVPIRYDAVTTVRYARLLYDALRKNLYGITTPNTGAALHKINAGAAPTVVYDFVAGRLDAIEIYQGNVVVLWNSGETDSGSVEKSRAYKYDGTSVTTLGELPDSVQGVGLKSYLGVLWIGTISADAWLPAATRKTLELYYIIGTTGPTRFTDLTPYFTVSDPTTGIDMGPPQEFVGVGRDLFVGILGFCARYDGQIGGISHGLGDYWVNYSGDKFGVHVGFVNAAGRILSLNQLYPLVGGAATFGVIRRLTGDVPIVSRFGAAGQEIISSRMDAALPFVDKFWFAFEVVLKDPMPADGAMRLEYSLDDGATWIAATPNPWNTDGEKRKDFVVQVVNAHIRYKVVFTGSIKISAVSAKFVPTNPDKKVWRFTTEAFDSIRNRGEKVEDAYAEDILAFLFNCAKQNEPVTFIEPNDSERTVHTVWVLSAKQSAASTGGEYDPTRNEGELDLVLWEA